MPIYLIIEDDPYYSEILDAILENEGIKSRIHKRAIDAYNDIKNINSYDGVILDLMMSKEDTLANIADGNTSAGETIFNKIRSVNTLIPIAVVTAKDEGSIISKIMRDENTLVVIKPTDKDDIKKIIEFLRGGV